MSAPGGGVCFHDLSTPLGLQQRDLSLCGCSGSDDGSLSSLDDLERLEEDEHRCSRSGGCDSDFSSSLESLDLELHPDESHYSAYISGIRSVSKEEAKRKEIREARIKRMELRKQMEISAEQTSWSSNHAVCAKKEPVIDKRRDSAKFFPDVKESWIDNRNLGSTRRKKKPPKEGHPALETTTKGRMPALIRRRMTLTTGFSRLGKVQKK
ncbi:hypothetical protein THAOC_36209 [Thalassiosira oceanica]|uniref:Uncharacterized protein n=1 Tax=Thalassiosira oceanica TaxID=159749 RepID=K0R0M7_THAOC|nr:hypothetical protein THAOC_36209 [Thalassiosira oceanica]|eukprot:EJK45190.1 hypothetical protein THAOC_36209 [Thalassiosira oceanica]